MQVPEGVGASRAFIKKALNFIKYYPLRRRDPALMLFNTINNLCHQINSAKDASDLETISEEVKINGNYQDTKGLCQIGIEEEERRVIVYRPSKFLESKEKSSEAVYLLDIVVID